MTPTFRFAPSPNGYLHLGHAFSALLNFDLARQTGGRFLLRIEDIDATRCRREYETAIYEDLAWLGIAWEEPVRRQSEHLDVYRAAIERLRRAGVVYASFESRAEIARLVREREVQGPWPRDPDGAPLYPGSPQTLPAAERARRVEAGEYEAALEPLFNALGYDVGPERRQTTRALLTRALDGVAGTRALDIQGLADAGDREAAIVRCDRLGALLRGVTDKGLTSDDLDDAFVKVQRLAATLGR